MSDFPFSYSYGPGATAAQIEDARAAAQSVARVRGTNRSSTHWQLNDCEESPGPCIAIRLRDGRFLECDDGPEALGLSWAKAGEADDIVEYLPARLA